MVSGLCVKTISLSEQCSTSMWQLKLKLFSSACLDCDSTVYFPSYSPLGVGNIRYVRRPCRPKSNAFRVSKSTTIFFSTTRNTLPTPYRPFLCGSSCRRIILQVQQLHSNHSRTYMTCILCLSCSLLLQLPTFLKVTKILWTQARRPILYYIANSGAKLILVTNLHCKLFQERMLTLLIIHHKFCLPSPSLVLASFM